MSVQSRPVSNLTGNVISSENSLNQHIKNKHPDLWETIKAKHEQAMENAAMDEQAEGEDAAKQEPPRTKKLSFDEIPIKFEVEE